MKSVSVIEVGVKWQNKGEICYLEWKMAIYVMNLA